MRKIIGLLGNVKYIDASWAIGLEQSYVTNDYVNVVQKNNATAIILPVVGDEESIVQHLDLCDGIILTGGQDIHPMFYNEEMDKNIANVNKEVDEYQIKITKLALEKDIPILGICRGIQLLNVVCGGSLYQDINNYNKNVLKHSQDAKRYEVAHKIKIEKDSILYKLYQDELWVNSYHHQSINILGKNLKITAKSSDGIVEAVEHIDKKFVMGVQWHPEMMSHKNENMNLLIKEFIKNC